MRVRRIVALLLVAAGVLAACRPIQPPAGADRGDGALWFETAVGGRPVDARSSPALAADAPRPRGRQNVALFVPRGAKPDRSRPTVVVLHGWDAFTPFVTRWARDLSQRGFVVVVGCWYRADRGYGYTPISCRGAPIAEGAGRAQLGEIRALVDVAAANPWSDPSKIAIAGYSRGGTMALHAAADRRFNVAAAIGLAPMACGVAHGPLQPADELPVDDVDAIRSPVMLVYASDDTNVRVDQHRCYSSALAQAGKDVTVVEYPTGGHYVWLEARRTDVLNRATAWLRAKLG